MKHHPGCHISGFSFRKSTRVYRSENTPAEKIMMKNFQVLRQIITNCNSIFKNTHTSKMHYHGPLVANLSQLKNSIQLNQRHVQQKTINYNPVVDWNYFFFFFFNHKFIRIKLNHCYYLHPGRKYYFFVRQMNSAFFYRPL